MGWERHTRRTRRGRVALGGLVGFLLLLLGHYSCTTTDSVLELTELDGEPVVRVKLGEASGKGEVQLTVGARYEVYARPPGAERGKLLARGTGLEAARVRAVGGQVELGGALLPAAWVELAPEQDGALRVGRLSYRGTLLVGAAGGRLLVINRVRMAQYLAGVIGCEMPLSWDQSALTAQAIAARTYALYELTHRRRAEPFDVFDSTASQVYRGKSAENETALLVVSRSRGMVLCWQGKPFKAFFHSTCGGQTAGAAQVFPQHDITPLSGRPCTHCQPSKVYRWTRRFERGALARKLARGLGKKIGRLDGIEVVDRTGGRVVKLRLLHDGAAVVLSAARLRSLVGAGRNGLLSTAFTVSRQGEQFVFEGRGWGHGVGLCQFGARGLAEQGRPASDIVRYYYPGAELVKLW